MEADKSDKTTRWAFTAYEGQWGLFATMPPLIAEWGWQQEVCPETKRLHYQGYIRTARQVRFNQIQITLPGVHVKPAKNWDALLNYCKKKETAVEGTQEHHVNNMTLTMAQALIRVAEYRDKDIDYSTCESVKDFKEKYVYEFDKAVAQILLENENLIGLYSQPQYERAYVKWRNVWTKKADEKTDRQTDTPVGEDEDAGRVQLATQPR